MIQGQGIGDTMTVLEGQTDHAITILGTARASGDKSKAITIRNLAIRSPSNLDEADSCFVVDWGATCIVDKCDISSPSNGIKVIGENTFVEIRNSHIHHCDGNAVCCCMRSECFVVSSVAQHNFCGINAFGNSKCAVDNCIITMNCRGVGVAYSATMALTGSVLVRDKWGGSRA